MRLAWLARGVKDTSSMDAVTDAVQTCKRPPRPARRRAASEIQRNLFGVTLSPRRVGVHFALTVRPRREAACLRQLRFDMQTHTIAENIVNVAFQTRARISR